MRALGIVRKVDRLGRVVIPMELRKSYEINEGDPLEIFVEGDSITLKKYKPACIFCGDAKETITYKEKRICLKCWEEIK